MTTIYSALPDSMVELLGAASIPAVTTMASTVVLLEDGRAVQFIGPPAAVLASWRRYMRAPTTCRRATI